jgi:hypothetical protein
MRARNVMQCTAVIAFINGVKNPKNALGAERTTALPKG